MKRKPTKKLSKRKVIKKVSKVKRKKVSKRRKNPTLEKGKRYKAILKNSKYPIHVYFKVINFWSDPEIKEGVVTDEGEILNLADFKEIEEWNPDEEQEWVEYYKYYGNKL